MKGAWILAILLAALCCAFANSRPQPQETGWPHESHQITNQKNQTASQFSAPTPIYISKNLQRAAHDPKDGGNNKYKHWWEAPTVTNPLMVLFSFFLVCVTAGQLYVYCGQKRIMARSLTAARRSLILARQSMRLARHEFNLVHAPNLVVRHFLALAYPEGNSAAISFEISNEGDQAASLNFDYATFIAKIEHGGTTDCPVTEFENYNGHLPKIRVGDRQRYKVHIKTTILAIYTRKSDWRVLAPPKTPIAFEFTGNNPYADAAGETRHCTFDVRYNFQTMEFEWAAGPEAGRTA